MKERGILFSAPMVRALLDGSKTQTRRVAKVPVDATDVRYWAPPSGRSQRGWADPGLNYWTPDANGATVSNHLGRCPHGQPGDRLWVREAWRSTGDGGRCNDMPPRDMQPHAVWYEAEGAPPADECAGKLRPGMFMPRWATRITLEITGVRVERLQDISSEDAEQEGVKCDMSPRGFVDHYQGLWERINGPGSWNANPWVWVVEFKKATP